jgi:glycerophosphoryl diester phosphodiesterase
LLSDNAAILFHDDEIDERECESFTLAELAGQKIIVNQLRELERYAGRAHMCLEVKKSKWEDVVLEHVEKWPDIVIASFDHTLIAEIHRRNTGIALGLTILGYIVDLAAYAKQLGATWVYPAYRYVDREMVESLHAAELRVVPWTPNRERDWQRLHDLGCDGIITDFPAEALSWFSGVAPGKST